MPRRPLTRRTLLAGAAGALAGCAAAPTGGPTGAPADRLVTLGGAAAGLALLLGPPQVGTASFLAADPLLDAIATIQRTPVTDVSDGGGEIDLERLAALGPDLLVGFDTPPPDPALNGLATLHAVPRTGDVDTDSRALAAGMGHADRADAVLAAVHARTAQVAARLREGRPPRVSVLSPGLDGASLHVLGTATPAGAVVEELGLARPAAQRGLTDPARPYLPVSAERFTEHDADLVLLLTGPTANPAFLRDQPLWQRLDAVRAGRVVEVDALRWATMSCLLGSWWVLDDLAALLLDGGAPVLGAASPAGLERLGGYRDRSTP
jgi:ABC-type Fe3+-hydroxamate transport system substrate-binding protein